MSFQMPASVDFKSLFDRWPHHDFNRERFIREQLNERFIMAAMGNRPQATFNLISRPLVTTSMEQMCDMVLAVVRGLIL